MKNQNFIALDDSNGISKAALIENGVLQDFLFDTEPDFPLPEEIHRARAARPLKGQNGMLLDLEGGQSGFLRNAKGIAPGDMLLVQVSTIGEAHKAAPVTEKLLFKSRYVIVTPGSKGRNIARSIRDEVTRARLANLIEDVLGDSGTAGLILRSCCAEAEEEEIAQDIKAMAELADAVTKDIDGPPELLVARPDTTTLAWRDWTDPMPDEIVEGDDAFERTGIWDHIENLRSPRVDLGNGAYMFIEPTSALVAVDVNTGSDFSIKSGQAANLAAARVLPKELRLRGLGGQITLDLAPMSKKDRQVFEQVLGAAMRADKTDTALVGWTPLGHFELQRKRDRLPLALFDAG